MNNEKTFDWIINKLKEREQTKNEEYLKCVKKGNEKEIAKAFGVVSETLQIIEQLEHWKFYEHQKHTISILDKDNHSKHIADITAIITTKEDIEKIFFNIRNTVDDWTYEDIKNALPSDCEWIDVEMSSDYLYM